MDRTIEQHALLVDGLAKRICYRGVGTASTSGLFIAVPPSVVISQLANDLRNALKPKGAQVLHVNLQHQPDQSCVLLIENAVRETFKANVVPHGKKADLECTGPQEAEQRGVTNARCALSSPSVVDNSRHRKRSVSGHREQQ